MTKMTGSATGPSRAAILETAHTLAAAYFGTNCVSVSLRDESCETLQRSQDGTIASAKFSANFDACVWHDLEMRSYGPNVCKVCKKTDWPHAQLNTPKGTE